MWFDNVVIQRGNIKEPTQIINNCKVPISYLVKGERTQLLRSVS